MAKAYHNSLSDNWDIELQKKDTDNNINLLKDNILKFFSKREYLLYNQNIGNTMLINKNLFNSFSLIFSSKQNMNNALVKNNKDNKYLLEELISITNILVFRFLFLNLLNIRLMYYD